MRFATARRVGAVAAMVCLAAGITTLPADASVAPTSFAFDSACQATEFTELHTGPDGRQHDFMYIDPTVNASTCEFAIVDMSNWSYRYGPTRSGRESGGVYDGPGNSLAACVEDDAKFTSGWTCGPTN